MSNRKSDFESAAEKSGGGLLSELWGFLKSNKKWWLLPIVIMFLVFSFLILLTSTGLGPFIYSHL